MYVQALTVLILLLLYLILLDNLEFYINHKIIRNFKLHKYKIC